MYPEIEQREWNDDNEHDHRIIIYGKRIGNVQTNQHRCQQIHYDKNGTQDKNDQTIQTDREWNTNTHSKRRQQREKKTI